MMTVCRTPPCRATVTWRGPRMGWGDQLGRHEGHVLQVFADGRFGGGVERGGIPVYAANGLTEMDDRGNSVQVRPAAAVIGWRVACFHAPGYVGDDDLAVWSGQPQLWTGPRLWRRVYSPAEEDLAAGQICASLSGNAGDLCVEDRVDVLELMHEEWRAHIVPEEHARSIRRALAAVADAARTVDLEVAAARAAGMTWADIGKTVGITRQAAHDRWGPAPAKS